VADLDPAPRARQRTKLASGSVAILSWPDEAGRMSELAQQGRPRLLLVAPDALPPDDWDQLTDWIRLPADGRDITVRMAALQRQAAVAGQPALDEFGVLRRGSRWTALAPVEARIIELLLAKSGSVVSRRELDAALPHGTRGRGVNVRLAKLREKIAHLGLTIVTVRSQGLLLEVASA
jgi:hypothetical protein